MSVRPDGALADRLGGCMQYDDNPNFRAFDLMSRKALAKGLQGDALFSAVLSAACLWLFDNGIVDVDQSMEEAKKWIAENPINTCMLNRCYPSKPRRFSFLQKPAQRF